MASDLWSPLKDVTDPSGMYSLRKSGTSILEDIGIPYLAQTNILKSGTSILDKDIGIPHLAQINIPSYERTQLFYSFPEEKLKDKRHGMFRVGESAHTILSECYLGNLDKVLTIHHLNPEIVHSHDNLKRTPLHYVAMGKGSIDIAKFLIYSGVKLDAKDLNGDTAFHIACHHGHLELMKFLHKKDHSFIQSCNNINFSALHEVALGGSDSVEVADYLINEGADIHARDDDGSTVFHLACRQGQLNLVEFLYKSDPSFIRELNNKQQTPLHYVAIGTGSVDVASYLLKNGANIDARDAQGSTIFHIACHQGHLNLVEFLYKRDPSLISKINNKQQIPLHYVAMGTGSVVLASYLLKNGSNIDARDDTGSTVFHIACLKGHLNLVEFLYKRDPSLISKLNSKHHTPLHYVAVGTGSVDMASYLLRNGADIHGRDDKGSTVFHMACYQGHLNLVEFLYKKDSSFINKLNNTQRTPLYYVAIGTGSVDVASYLLKNGPDIHERDDQGSIVFHLACTQGHLNLVEFLYKKDPSLIRELNNKQQTPLHQVAMGTGSVDVASYLLEHEADIHARDDVGSTVLHIACHQGHLNLVEFLYKRDPSLIRELNNKQQTPLHYVAMGTGSVDVASYLLKKGADIQSKDDNVSTVFHIACHQGHLNLVEFLYKRDPSLIRELNNKQQTPLHYVAMGTGSVDMASYLLKNGANIDARDDVGSTVFHLACLKGHLNLVEFLYKSDPSLIRELNNKQQTPLHQVAMGTGSVDVASYLLEHEADIHARDDVGSTVLHIACHQGHLNLVEFLYKRDPSLIRELNNKQQTPLHYVAMGTGSVDLASYLLRNGANIDATDNVGSTVFHIACQLGQLNLVEVLYKKDPLLISKLNNKQQTPLHYVAVGTGSVDVASYLLKNGANIQARDDDGSTAFHIACQLAHLNLVEFLHKKDPSLISELNNTQQTPLHYVAIGTGSVDVASYLLNKGADRQARDDQGSIVFHIAQARDDQGSTVFHIACHRGHLNLVEFLYKRDQSLIKELNNKQQTPLHYVAMGTGSVDVASCLLKNMADIHERDDHGSTVFQIACFKGHLNLVEFLYKKDPSLISKLNNIHQTPLHYVALGTGSVEVADYLITEGADIQVKDVSGNTALHWACNQGHLDLVKFLDNKDPMLIKAKNKKGSTCLDYVAKGTRSVDVADFLFHKDPEILDNIKLKKGTETSQMVEIIQKIFCKAIIGYEYKLIQGLIESGVDVNKPSEDGACPIHYAAKTGHVKIIQVLIDHGCALDAQDNQGQTALHITCRNGYLDATRLLVSKGANLVLQDKEGKDALIYAIENNRPETVSFLLGQNIDLVTDKQGKTPLEYAIKMGKNGLINLLAQYEQGRSKGDVYVKYMELAIATDCNCLGEFTTHAMLQDYFRQDKSTSEDSSISHIAVQVLTLLCKTLQAKIPKQLLVKVWPVYENSKHGPVSLIAYVTDVPNTKMKSLFGLEVIYRLYNFVNEEESVVIHSDLEKNNPILGKDLKKIIGIIDENAKELSDNHSNLTMISCSSVKSRNLGTSLTPEHCIVLYCRYKGKIPFGEREFPPKIGQFSTDVREGYVSLNSNVNYQQMNLWAEDDVGSTVFHLACLKGHLNLVEFLYKSDPSLIRELNNKQQTPLHQVAMGTGSVDVASYLLEHEADIHARDDVGSTVLHIACHQGHLNLVEFLYKRDPSLIRELNNKQQTPLHYVAMGTGSVDLASYLLRNGANIDATDNVGSTVFHIACQLGQLNLVEVLYKKDPLLISKLNNKQQTPLHYVAVGTGSVDVASYLLKNGANIQARDDDGSTAFHIACQLAHLNLVEFLHKKDPSLISELNNTQQTPLHYVAIGTGSVDVASYLLNKGADRQARDDQGSIVFHIAQARDDQGSTVFHIACHRGHLNLVEFLYKRDQSLISKLNNKQQTPLHYVAMGTGSVDVASCLLKNMADIHERDDYGSTVFQIACFKGHLNLVEFLYKKDPSLISKLNNKHQTPLHSVALGTGSVEVADYLITEGADIQVKDVSGNTVLHCACNQGHLDLVKFLDNKDPMLIKAKNKKGSTCLDYVAKGTRSVDVADFLFHKDPEILDNIKLKKGTETSQMAEIIQKIFCKAIIGYEYKLIRGLTESSVDVNKPSEDGSFPIHYAAETGHVKIIQVLIDHGCVLDAQNNQGQTALHLACRHGFLDATRLLASKGANLVLQDKEGKDALIYAIKNKRLETVSFLLGQNIDLVTDKQGKPPLQYAIETGNIGLISLLAQYEHGRSKEDVYIKYMKLAIATDCSCLGEFTTHAMLQDYFTQDIITSEDSSISHIAVQVLTLLCKTLQAKIPKQLLVKVWPVYENSKHGPVSLIAYVTDIPDFKLESLFGLEVIYRLYNFVNEEESIVIHSDLEKNNPILGEDLKKIIGMIDENAKELSANHSNLTMISCSPVKSRKLGTSLTPEHCIVLYCRYKGKIPFGEREFPPKIGQFSTDVREGYVSLNSNVNNQQKNLPANDRHDILRMGCSISRQCSDASGTLGGFIDWEQKVHFITCAHVLFSSTECMTEDGIVDVNDAGTAIQVCQPGDGDAGSGRYSPTHRLSGKVKKACFNPPDREVSVDAALVEITDARAPAVSEFIGIDKQDMKECGFNEVPNMTQMQVFDFNPFDESHLDCRIFKVGAKTGMTRGVLRLNGAQAFINPSESIDFPDRSIAVDMRKQIMVLKVKDVFFKPGDSGAFVFIRKNGMNYCLGLAIASFSPSGMCFVTPIKEVLAALSLTEEDLLGSPKEEDMDVE